MTGSDKLRLINTVTEDLKCKVHYNVESHFFIFAHPGLSGSEVQIEYSALMETERLSDMILSVEKACSALRDRPD
jgi:hypothetical protein